MENKLVYKTTLTINDRKNLSEISDNLQIFSNKLSHDRRTYCRQVAHKIQIICLRLKIVINSASFHNSIINVYDLDEVLSRLEAQRHLMSGTTIEFATEYMACIDHACEIVFDIIDGVLEGLNNE